jgi:hypothetical protein
MRRRLCLLIQMAEEILYQIILNGGDRIDDLHKDVSDLQCISIEKIESFHPRNIVTEVTL